MTILASNIITLTKNIPVKVYTQRMTNIFYFELSH